ncbi:MAG: bifunctional DNA-formamidopyrimidine glycosylase/DNA-(apurinic or apyrimidinic site) lyase [Alphaproteobacteria bacterium]|nr:bifunctional DNA-formamidopyrimidine glycosylase/DNA-(apurinic or apyrimidinic site) lyase [Alphaproteobacteria bacterium]
MPELPEVETVRRGIAPAFEGATIAAVSLRRPDLRFPLPTDFARRLTGARVGRVWRRGKYICVDLDLGDTLIMHLGMSGRFSVRPKCEALKPEIPKPEAPQPEALEGEVLKRGAPAARVAAGGTFHYAIDADPRHDHVEIDLEGPTGRHVITYNDPRRFGFMDLAPTREIDVCRHFSGMGPEPLSDAFSDAYFTDRLADRATPIKAALLDQSVVAGVGNIYACEALHRAGISPRRKAASVAGVRAGRLRAAIVDVLVEAIDAGGSTLRDFAAADGALGYFQHRFDVYGREGAACRRCGGAVARLVQAGRSTYYCGGCQR